MTPNSQVCVLYYQHILRFPSRHNLKLTLHPIKMKLAAIVLPILLPATVLAAPAQADGSLHSYDDIISAGIETRDALPGTSELDSLGGLVARNSLEKRCPNPSGPGSRGAPCSGGPGRQGTCQAGLICSHYCSYAGTRNPAVCSWTCGCP
jgi:hypothetical protein